MRTPSAVDGTGSVMAGDDVAAEPLMEAGAAPDATPGAAARKHKGKAWSTEEQIAVMDACAVVSGDPTNGASQCATEFVARIERRFLAKRWCPAKDEFKNSTGGARQKMSLKTHLSPGTAGLPSVCAQQK
jgi:hypothetical protein